MVESGVGADEARRRRGKGKRGVPTRHRGSRLRAGAFAFALEALGGDAQAETCFEYELHGVE